MDIIWLDIKLMMCRHSIRIYVCCVCAKIKGRSRKKVVTIKAKHQRHTTKYTHITALTLSLSLSLSHRRTNTYVEHVFGAHIWSGQHSTVYSDGDDDEVDDDSWGTSRKSKSWNTNVILANSTRLGRSHSCFTFLGH